MERKTPRRAGCSPPYEPTPLGGCRWCGWNSTSCQANLPVHPCPDSQCADRLPLRCCLRTAVVAWGIFSGLLVFRLNIFHAIGLAPSGGHILSSPTKKEYGKKDAARVAGGPRPTNPPPWVGVGGAGGLVRATRQICEYIRALIAGVRAACRFAVAYVLRKWLDGFFAGLHPLPFQRKSFRDVSLQASTLRRKRKRSGKRFAHQAGRRMQLQICLAAGTVCGCSPDAVCRGGFLGQGDRPLP